MDFDSAGITLQFFFYKFIFFFNVGLYLQTRMDLEAVYCLITCYQPTIFVSINPFFGASCGSKGS